MPFSYILCPITTLIALKYRTLFLFLYLNRMLVKRAIIDQMLVRIANQKDFDQKQSGLGLHCLPLKYSILKKQVLCLFISYLAY